jgi:hypothetical protein
MQPRNILRVHPQAAEQGRLEVLADGERRIPLPLLKGGPGAQHIPRLVACLPGPSRLWLNPQRAAGQANSIHRRSRATSGGKQRRNLRIHRSHNLVLGAFAHGVASYIY